MQFGQRMPFFWSLILNFAFAFSVMSWCLGNAQAIPPQKQNILSQQMANAPINMHAASHTTTPANVQTPTQLTARATDLSATLQVSVCADRVAKILGEWQAQPPWYRGLGPAPGHNLYRAPSKDFGKWIEVLTSPKHTKLSLIAEDGIVSIKWQTGCQAAAHFHPLKPGRSRLTKPELFKGFAVLKDSTLKKLFSEGKPGIVFLWSPHKPISIFGLREALAAARQLRIKLIPVVDTNADPESIRREAQFVGLNPKDVYIFDSMDLQMRGFRLHFPSLIVYQAGGYSSPVRKGYESAKTYQSYFTEYTGIRATTAVEHDPDSVKKIAEPIGSG